jgi:carbonic anhydrase/acetyltransferase-like protein (isoleucine patch superfamily)
MVEMIHPFKDRTPKISEKAYVAESAQLIGNVTIGESVILFNAVIRGDRSMITIGNNTSIQDNAVIHADPVFPTEIGNNVTVGHGAVLHGCKINSNTLVGMNSTVLNGAEIGSFSIIGAGAVVTQGSRIPERSLVLGIPGKVVREVKEDELRLIKESSDIYVKLRLDYLSQRPK